jgi:hypothetical protein
MNSYAKPERVLIHNSGPNLFVSEFGLQERVAGSCHPVIPKLLSSVCIGSDVAMWKPLKRRSAWTAMLVKIYGANFQTDPLTNRRDRPCHVALRSV